MENQDRELVQRVLNETNNPRLRKLLVEHDSLDDQVGTLGKKSFLTTPEELKLKQLKAQKLSGVEEMLMIARAAVV